MNLILVSFYFGDWPLSISVCMYTTVEGISSPAIGVLLNITIKTKQYSAIHSLLDVNSCFLVFFQLDRVISIGVDLLTKYCMSLWFKMLHKYVNSIVITNKILGRFRLLTFYVPGWLLCSSSPRDSIKILSVLWLTAPGNDNTSTQYNWSKMTSALFTTAVAMATILALQINVK